MVHLATVTVFLLAGSITTALGFSFGGLHSIAWIGIALCVVCGILIVMYIVRAAIRSRRRRQQRAQHAPPAATGASL